MISKTDLSLWLSALGIVVALHVTATGILCLLIGLLLGRTCRRR